MKHLRSEAPNFLFLWIAIFFLASCVSHKDLITLNGSDPELERGANVDLRQQKAAPYTPFTIQPLDLLSINVNAFEGNTSEFLMQEFGARNLNNMVRDFGPNALYYNSYMVDEQGFVVLPLLNRLKVVGLTTEELKVQLDSAYAPHLKFASTIVKLANMRVTVLGEVKNPGIQYFFNQQTTILEALSMAGDFTDFANRKKVKIIRRNEQGISRSAILDLNKPDFIETEFFYVRPNDMIYVEPIKAKSFDVGAQSVGIVLSVISTAALLANIFIDTNK